MHNMFSFTLEEAQLYRMLGELFGKDQVIAGMSVLAVCGGTLPEQIQAEQPSIRSWAKENKCLFTIVDHEDLPKAVVEFVHSLESTVELAQVEHQRFLRPILSAAGIVYLTISIEEFGQVLDPEGNIDFPTLLRAKYEEAKT